jgi:thiol:disulfide interchange protein DsbC
MISLRTPLRALAATVLGLAFAGAAIADEAAIRKGWLDANPGKPAPDEITRTPIAGLWEVRVGTEIFYMDEKGEHVVFPSDGNSSPEGTGHIIELKTKRDLTQTRIDKLMAIDIDHLPMKDAMVMKQGNGARRLVIFEDPNCGYCKRLEQDLVALKDVTIYTFLIPILGGDSPIKARDIWCAKDNAHVWRQWMLSGERAPRQMGKCDFSAIERNTAMAQKFRISGTPALIFEDGSRLPGAVPLDELEKQMTTRVKKT